MFGMSEFTRGKVWGLNSRVIFLHILKKFGFLGATYSLHCRTTMETIGADRPDELFNRNARILGPHVM
ncbi:hypothetical protein AK812_SmicGene8036 [Symbiodinium microadriaticum]|uniref:Uncharacterized protein n=1 Tax=Symbiodinium microadriaticum TaxID=2951 RepID=A0A1Q9EM68_SYMMI|nr:hypothetical protein AK812_SmicGene8036 [Symbiodinium microadriaticum]